MRKIFVPLILLIAFNEISFADSFDAIYPAQPQQMSTSPPVAPAVSIQELEEKTANESNGSLSSDDYMEFTSPLNSAKSFLIIHSIKKSNELVTYDHMPIQSQNKSSNSNIFTVESKCNERSFRWIALNGNTSINLNGMQIHPKFATYTENTLIDLMTKYACNYKK